VGTLRGGNEMETVADVAVRIGSLADSACCSGW